MKDEQIASKLLKTRMKELQREGRNILDKSVIYYC